MQNSRLHNLSSYRSDLPNVINELRSKKPTSAKSHLSSLEPFLDANGILRCGGRLVNANLPYNTEHPIILHCKLKLAKLLTKHAHETYRHASCTFVLAYLQKKYYLIHGGHEAHPKYNEMLCILYTHECRNREADHGRSALCPHVNCAPIYKLWHRLCWTHYNPLH